MAVNDRRLIDVFVTWSIVAQFLFICSGEAYPGDDFFFHDQSSKVVRRSVEKPIKVSNDEIMLNDMANYEGSGSGDDSDGEIGWGSGDGEDFSSTVELHIMTQESKVFDQTEKSKEEITTELSSINFATTRKPPLELVSTELSHIVTQEVTVFNQTGKTNEEITTAELSPITSQSPLELMSTELSHTMTPEVTVFNQTGKTNEEITTAELSPITSQSPLELMSTEVSHTMTQEVTVLNQTEKINEAITTEITSITFPTTTRQPPLELVSIEVCGKRYYCPKGSRGPCLANEILVEENDSNNSTEGPSYCSALHNYPWKGCLSQVSQETDASSLSARCTLKSTEEPCSGLPSHYRYDPVKKICRPASISTGDWLVYECGDDQFYVGLNRETSSCRCLNEFHLIYKKDNKCYHPFTRGPCDKGMWLEPSSRREVNCSPSPCPENQIDGRHFYWKGHFHGPAGCYRTNTRGPCPEDRTFVVTDYVLGHARCRRNWNATV